jgi:CPA1 family monovalent cation:H+ antiporter
VLATVTAGLYISWNGLRLISAATRLQGIFFWNFLIYLTDGFVFLITGLQARTLIAGIRGERLTDLAVSAAVVCAVVIVARFVWAFPATYLPRWLVPSIARKDPAPPWQWTFALSFTGVRGMVSLAAALAIPLTTESGAPFPDRDRILFGTFSALIRALGLVNAGRLERQGFRDEELAARRQAVEAASRRLDELVARHAIAEEIVRPLRARHRERLENIERRGDGDGENLTLIEAHDEIECTLIAVERQEINELYRQGKLKDEPRRRIERGLDLREEQLNSLRAEE